MDRYARRYAMPPVQGEEDDIDPDDTSTLPQGPIWKETQPCQS